MEPGAVMALRSMDWTIENVRKLARLLQSVHGSKKEGYDELQFVVGEVETEGKVFRGQVDPTMARENTT